MIVQLPEEFVNVATAPEIVGLPTSSNVLGEVVPMPTLPYDETMKLGAAAADEDATRNTGSEIAAEPGMKLNCAHGVDVAPNDNLPLSNT